MSGIRSKDSKNTRPTRQVDERAQAIIDEARKAGEELLEQTRAEIAEMVEQSRSQGIQEGQQQAEHLREEINGLRERMVKEVEGEVVRASLRVAGELLTFELSERPDAIVELVCSALKTARDAKDVFLRVNPRDAEMLRQNKRRLVDALGRAREVLVREDRQVEPGGVLIQTEAGVVDAQLATQLEEISTLWGA